MHRIGALIPCLALAAGIILNSSAAFPWWPGALAISFAAAIYLFILHYSRHPVAAFRLGKWHSLWVIFLFLGIGMLDECLNRPLTLEDAFGYDFPSSIQGEVVRILPKTYGDRLDVEIYGTNGALVQIRSGATSLRVGDIVSFPSARLKRLAADTSAVNYHTSGMLESKGFLYSAFIPARQIVADGHNFSFRNLCADIRQEIEIRMEKSHLSRPAANFLKAVLMGDKNGLDESTRLTFSQGGTAHMLALSGLHMSILAGMIMWLMWPLRAAGRYKWGYACAAVILWGYVFVTGMSDSSVRACIMISFAFIAIIMERKNAIGQSLASACLLILIVSPKALFDAGFQLSVVCVAALIAFASRLNAIDHRRHPRIYRSCEALLTTMVASAASLPLTSFYFGQIPLMFLPTNVLLLPLLPLYLCAGVIFTFFLCLGWEPAFLTVFLDMGFDFLLWATGTLSAGGEYVLSYRISLPALLLCMLLLSSLAIFIHRTSQNLK